MCLRSIPPKWTQRRQKSQEEDQKGRKDSRVNQRKASLINDKAEDDNDPNDDLQSEQSKSSKND